MPTQNVTVVLKTLGGHNKELRVVSHGFFLFYCQILIPVEMVDNMKQVEPTARSLPPSQKHSAFQYANTCPGFLSSPPLLTSRSRPREVRAKEARKTHRGDRSRGSRRSTDEDIVASELLLQLNMTHVTDESTVCYISVFYICQ